MMSTPRDTDITFHALLKVPRNVSTHIPLIKLLEPLSVSVRGHLATLAYSSHASRVSVVIVSKTLVFGTVQVIGHYHCLGESSEDPIYKLDLIP